MPFQKGHTYPNTGRTRFKKGNKPPHTGKTKKEFPYLANAGVKKGNIPWNKGKKLSKQHIENLSKSHKGQKPSLWKGENANNSAIHQWVRRHRGKPQSCEHCGAVDRMLNWANIDHKYRRELNEYISLCIPCHRAYDYRSKQPI